MLKNVETGFAWRWSSIWRFSVALLFFSLFSLLFDQDYSVWFFRLVQFVWIRNFLMGNMGCFLWEKPAVTVTPPSLLITLWCGWGFLRPLSLACMLSRAHALSSVFPHNCCTQGLGFCCCTPCQKWSSVSTPNPPPLHFKFLEQVNVKVGWARAWSKVKRMPENLGYRSVILTSVVCGCWDMAWQVAKDAGFWLVRVWVQISVQAVSNFIPHLLH